jgi:hypothetical protein
MKKYRVQVKQKKFGFTGPQIFLSYAREDEERIREIYRRLSKAKLSPWLDLEDLLPGQEWKKAILSAIKDSKFVLIFLTEKSINKRGYIQKEIAAALDIAEEIPDGDVFIIPVRLEPCSVPDRLAKWQWVDLFEHNGLDLLLNALRQHLGTDELLREEDVDLDVEPDISDEFFDALLLERVLARDFLGYGTIKSGKFAISYGVFLEFRSKAPTNLADFKAAASTHYKLTDARINRILKEAGNYKHPINTVQSIERYQGSIEEFLSVHILRTVNGIECLIDSRYVTFITMRYRNCKIYVTGANKPIVVEKSNELRCMCMPVRPEEE